MTEIQQPNPNLPDAADLPESLKRQGAPQRHAVLLQSSKR